MTLFEMTQASVRASLAKEEAASLISDEEENNKILSVTKN